MAISSKEKQKTYREKQYAAGLKQTRIWIPREPEKKNARIERQTFVQAMDALTAGWSKAQLSRLFNDLLKVIIIEKERKEEARKK